MATAGIVYEFSDGDALRCWVEIEGDYPDALNEARATVERLYADALEATLTNLLRDADEG